MIICQSWQTSVEQAAAACSVSACWCFRLIWEERFETQEETLYVDSSSKQSGVGGEES